MERTDSDLQSQPTEIIFKIFDYLADTDLARLRKVSHAVGEITDNYQEYRVRANARKCHNKILQIQYRFGITPIEYYGTMTGTNLQSVITNATYTSPCIDIPVEYSVRKIDRREVIMLYRSNTILRSMNDNLIVNTVDVFELVMNYYSINTKQGWCPSSIRMHGRNNRITQLYKALTGESYYYSREYKYNGRQTGIIR